MRVQYSVSRGWSLIQGLTWGRICSLVWFLEEFTFFWVLDWAPKLPAGVGGRPPWIHCHRVHASLSFQEATSFIKTIKEEGQLARRSLQPMWCKHETHYLRYSLLVTDKHRSSSFSRTGGYTRHKYKEIRNVVGGGHWAVCSPQKEKLHDTKEQLRRIKMIHLYKTIIHFRYSFRLNVKFN